MAGLPVGPLEFLEVCFVVLLVEQRFFLVSELPVLETIGELVRPVCPDGDFNEAECFQQERAQSLVK